MAERTITQADGLGLIATVLLGVALLVAAIFVFTGLTTPPPPVPAAAESAAAPEQPAADAPAGEAPAAN